LKRATLDIWLETKDNYLFLPFLLVLGTIPLPYAFGSISMGIFVGLSLLFFRKQHLVFRKALLFPVLIYLIMAASLFWTIDFSATTSALFKAFPLLLVPACFFVNKPFTEFQYRKIIQYFGYIYVGYALFYLLRASVRFLMGSDSTVFFYHELVKQDVNAIHVSVYMALAFFAIVTKRNKTLFDKFSLAILALVIFLLSSKNVLLVFLLLNVFYFLFCLNFQNRKKNLWIGLGLMLVLAAFFFQNIWNRFEIEVTSNLTQNTLNTEISSDKGAVYNVSVYEAWNNDTFHQNDFFPGAAMRVYQFRIFLEMFQENPTWYLGYGLNATKPKIIEKRIEHNLYEGYDEFNFHNQYVQFFAEIGLSGFLLLVVMLAVSLKNALRSKDFVYISFSVLMISLFLTESFLSRQRGIIFFMVFYCLFAISTRRIHKRQT